MRKTTFFLCALIMLLLGSSSFAAQSAIIGGIRDGAALGLMFESGSINAAKLRLGFEANTSNTPVIVLVGGKWYLSDVSNRFPMFLSAGLVGYLGNSSEAGPYISVMFERLLAATPLFLEIGIDVVKSGKLQLQVGYYF